MTARYQCALDTEKRFFLNQSKSVKHNLYTAKHSRLIDGHKDKVFLEEIHVTCPRLHSVVFPLLYPETHE